MSLAQLHSLTFCFSKLLEEEGGPRPKARPWWWALHGRIVGGNVGARIFLDGAVELGNPNGADSGAVTLRQAQGRLSGK
jgi:hypothetical protein